MKLRCTLILLLAPSAIAQNAAHWVATWATAETLLRPQPPANPPAQPSPGSSGFKNQTVRMIARTSIGGNRIRIKVENAYNSAPLTIGAAHVALRSKDSAIVPGSDHAITFNGKPGCILSPGVERISDPVDLKVPRSPISPSAFTSPAKLARPPITAPACTPPTSPRKATSPRKPPSPTRPPALPTITSRPSMSTRPRTPPPW